jgi:hypothetical protein
MSLNRTDAEDQPAGDLAARVAERHETQDVPFADRETVGTAPALGVVSSHPDCPHEPWTRRPGRRQHYRRAGRCSPQGRKRAEALPVAEIGVQDQHARLQAAKRFLGVSEGSRVTDHLNLIASRAQLRQDSVATGYEHSRAHIAKLCPPPSARIRGMLRVRCGELRN